MKIGIETDTMDRPGMGTAVYTRNMVQSLLDADSGFEFCLFHSKPVEDALYNRAHEMFVPQIRTPFMDVVSSNMAFYLQARGRFDIVHYPRQTVYPLFWLPGRKVVVSILDAGYLLMPKMTNGHQPLAPPRRRPTALLKDGSLKYCHSKIDAVITPSQASKNQIVQYYGIPAEKIYFIPLGRNPAFRPLANSETLAADMRKKYGLEQPYILNVGRIQPHKNTVRLVQAFGQLKQDSTIPHKLVIVGRKYLESTSKRVMTLIDELNLQQEVIILEYVSLENLIKIYNLADLFIFPSLFEGFGFPPLEAMACGTPVITSNVTSIPEVVGDSGLLVDPWDVDDIADKMRWLVKDPELRKELSEKGLQRAPLFSWEKYANQVLDIYRMLLGLPR